MKHPFKLSNFWPLLDRKFLLREKGFLVKHRLVVLRLVRVAALFFSSQHEESATSQEVTTPLANSKTPQFTTNYTISFMAKHRVSNFRLKS